MAERTILYAIRHGMHGKGVPKNVLTPEAEWLAILVGKRLKSRGIKFDYVFSSPQGRAISTVLLVMQGMGEMLPLSAVAEEIGDAGLGAHPFSSEQLDGVKARAKEAIMGVEEYILQDKTPDIAQLQIARGAEGAAYIQQMVTSRLGLTGAFCSHGGSRLEISILELMQRSPHYHDAECRASFVFDEGGVAVMIFDEMGNLQKCIYLGDLAEI